MPHFTSGEWLLAILAAFCIGLSKSGFLGLGMATVIIFTRLFPAMESTGVLLPLLICGDVGAVIAFRQHADWRQIRRMLPPTAAGIVAAWIVMQHLPGGSFKAVIGWIVLLMTVMQGLRRLRPDLYAAVPHTRRFAWIIGLGSGVTTMLANAAGPIMALYFVAIDLPKLALVGTGAWFFLIVNVFKVPFSASLGLIHGRSLLLNAMLISFVAVGVLCGHRLVGIVSQRLFEGLLLLFTTIASLHLIGLF